MQCYVGSCFKDVGSLGWVVSRHSFQLLSAGLTQVLGLWFKMNKPRVLSSPADSSLPVDLPRTALCGAPQTLPSSSALTHQARQPSPPAVLQNLPSRFISLPCLSSGPALLIYIRV